MTDLLKFIQRIETVAKRMDYGTMSCNVMVLAGQPNIKTFYIVRSKRKRFPPGKGVDTESKE